MNSLYFGDSLDILKQLWAKHPDGFIDLVYIDPPFNSKRNYNILFETIDLHDAKAQKEAFADTWSNVGYKDTIEELKDTNLNLSRFLEALDHAGISQSAVSYLTTMAIRSYYIHKVLKPTGSFYLHCDQSMSHYLKVVCDLIFGEKHFRDEIIWKRTFNTGSSKAIANKFPVSTDTILYYTKSDKFTFNKLYRPYSDGALKRYDKEDEEGKVFKWNPLKTVSKERLAKMLKSGEAKITPNSKYPVYKHYFDESKGAVVDNLWDDIEQLGTKAAERLGYPTQKPEALLQRIILTSSNKGDLVADFFCGCGTTVSTAQSLKRNWIGVDISHLAIGLIRKRIIDTYGEKIVKTFSINGLPKDIGSAKALSLAPQGRMHFQDWVIETLLGGVANPKKSGDGGYDGYTTLEIDKGKKEVILIQVKSGKTNVNDLRSFAKTVQQQKGSVGILVCFEDQITKGMRSEAKGEGYFRKDLFDTRFDKIQLLSIEELLDGKMPELPRSYEVGPFKKADRVEEPDAQGGLF